MLEFENLPGKKKAINIVERIGSDYESFGIQLLNDEEGVIVGAIEDDCNGKSAKITKAILKRWLNKGKSPTWETLVKVLRVVSLNGLADDVCEALGFSA